MTEEIELEAQLELSQSSVEQKAKLFAFFVLGVAVFALSFTAIFIKISISEISANATVFNRFWLAAILFGVWSGWNRLRLQSETKESSQTEPDSIIYLVLLLGVGVAHVSGRFLWTWSLTQTGTANATILSNLAPLFTTLGGWLFLKQTFDRRFIIGMFIALAGAVTLGLNDLGVSQNNFIGDIAALVSAMFYVASFLIAEKLRTKFSTINILLFRCVIGTLIIFPITVIFEEQVFPISWTGWFAVLALAIICEGLGHGLVVYSLKNFSSSFVTIFLLIEPVLTAILAWIIFAERLHLLNWLALAVVLQGVYLAQSSKGADKQ